MTISLKQSKLHFEKTKEKVDIKRTSHFCINYADRGGCYPPRLKAEVDNVNILQDLHN